MSYILPHQLAHTEPVVRVHVRHDGGAEQRADDELVVFEVPALNERVERAPDRDPQEDGEDQKLQALKLAYQRKKQYRIYVA